MCYDQACLGYTLLAVIAGFAGLIFFLLKYRKRFLEANLQITADQVWSEVVNRGYKTNFSKSDLLFGIWQDKSSTEISLIVKNHQNEIVGRVDFSMGVRKFKISTGHEIFDVDFPLTWKRTAHLRTINSNLILASYLKLNIFGKHQFKILDYGTVIAKRPNLGQRLIFDYGLNNILIGVSQEISSRRQIGRIIILPSNMPLHLRIFILAL